MLRCYSRFQRAFTACVWVFKVVTLVDSSQRNYFENATARSKRMLKTTVATQLKYDFNSFRSIKPCLKVESKIRLPSFRLISQFKPAQAFKTVIF